MEILGVGLPEFLVIAVVALLVIKPADWGKTGRMLAGWANQITTSDAWRAMNESWRAASEFSTELRREANLEKSLLELDEFTNPRLNRRNPAHYSDPRTSHPPQAGQPETNVIRPPHSTAVVAKKSPAKKPPRKRPNTAAPAKRKPKKTNA